MRQESFFVVQVLTDRFVPEDADRADSPDSDKKARFTSVEAGAADGMILHIAGHQSKSQNDLSRTTFLRR